MDGTFYISKRNKGYIGEMDSHVEYVAGEED